MKLLTVFFVALLGVYGAVMLIDLTRYYHLKRHVDRMRQGGEIAPKRGPGRPRKARS